MKCHKPMETVLIVEDDPTMLRGLKDNFEFQGYHVLTATTAPAGLRAVRTGRPAAILLDLRLPNVEDGLDVLRELRSRGNMTPVAVVTGHYGLGDETDSEIRRLHASIVYKPLWVENILALVRDLLGR